MRLQPALWAAQRIAFHAYIGVCMVTIVGGWLTAPLFTQVVFGDWRFWRHLKGGLRLYLHAYKILFLILKGENSGFMFSVPLTSAPFSSPDRSIVQLNRDWEDGNSCGSCTRCCSKIDCPILEPDTGLCGGYDSFFWRYFNCGRYPSKQREIDYYGCPKWVMRPVPHYAPGTELPDHGEAIPQGAAHASAES